MNSSVLDRRPPEPRPASTCPPARIVTPCSPRWRGSDSGGGVPCDRISTKCPAFEVMSKRRRGHPERGPCPAEPQDRPRRQGALRAARPRRPLSVRQPAPVRAVLSQFGLLSTARIV